jgi:two-component system sensor histidine kinase QseC
VKKSGRGLKSLQARLLVPLLALLTAVWLAILLTTWLDVQHELDELLDGHLAQAAALLVTQQVGESDHESVEDAPSLHKYAPRVMFQVFHEGRLMLRSANAGATPMSAQGPGFSTERIGRDVWRVFATTGVENDVQVYVGELSESRDEILIAVLQGVMWPLAFALPLLALLGWWAVRKGLAPLRQLSHLLGQRRPQALEPLQIDHLPSEMETVVQALNALFDRIEHMVAAERRFTSDAAHELRTPIAAIRAQAQVAMGAGDDGVQREHALQATLAGCDRATRLVEQLLTLARLEEGPVSSLTSVDLSALARRVAADLAPTALERQQSLELDAIKPCAVLGAEMLVAVLVRNLIDNAIRYSPDRARIWVSVETEAGQAVLRVQDSGPGMTEAELARLGERFFRVLGTEQLGNGLGWSIVARIAAVLNASIEVKCSEMLGGLAVTVRWPMPAQA